MEIVTHTDREIGGRKYRVHPFLGRECFKHYAALLKLLGEPLAQGLIAAVSPKIEKEKSPVDYLKRKVLDKEVMEYLPAVAAALATLTERLEPDELLAMITAMTGNVRTLTVGENGREIEHPLNIDLDFGGGRMKPLFSVFLFVLEVNFADFLPDGFSLAKAAKDAAAAVQV